MTRTFISVFNDFAIFIVFLTITTLYPLWGDITGRREKHTKANYVFASGHVSIISMMFSIARGTLSVRALLGFPSELFYRGAELWETLYGFITAYPVVCFVFVPVYCNLGITSVYQYLDLRFRNKLVKRIASISYIMRNCLSMGVNLYTPCVALNTIAGVPNWLSLFVMTVISIIFTFMGGLKAAITADVIQGSVFILISILITVQGTYETGNLKDVYNINRENGRLDFFKITGDITTRVDTFSAWFGQMFIYICVLGCEQNMVQRYLSMKSIKQVRKTLMANIPLTILLFQLPWFAGVAIYSAYSKCDPLEAGYIKKIDGILPFFVYDKLTYIPGFLGLFLASLFSGSLCVNVSNLNSLATCTYEDFICRLPRFKTYEDKKQVSTIKYIAMIYAIITMIIGYCTGFLPGIIETAFLTSSATTGPLVGVFTLAMLIPMANGWGAAIGMITAHITTLIIILGSFTITTSSVKSLPTSILGCTNTTFSPWLTPLPHSSLNTCLANCSVAESTLNAERSFVDTIFGMSFMYYSVLGTFVTIVIGIIASWLTKSPADDQYNVKLLHPIVRKFIKYTNSYPTNDAINNEVSDKFKGHSTIYTVSKDYDVQRKSKATSTCQPTFRQKENLAFYL